MAKQITLVTTGSKAHYSQANLDANFEALNENFDNFLHLNGSREASNSMLGPIDMGTYKVTNLGTPTGPTDAVTKNYADTLVVSTTAASSANSVRDADNDTYVNTELTTDQDIIHIAAPTSGGAADAMFITGTVGSAEALTNPSITIKKHVIL